MGITFLLVDALNLIRRVYAAQPGDDGAQRVKDALTTTVHSLQRALRECQPTHAVCVFDGQGPGWRYELYAGYKAGRTPMPEALQSSLKTFEEAFLELGVPSLTFPTLEADDVIATLASKVALRKSTAIILSTDKMYLQLLSNQIKIRDHFNKRDMDHAYVMEKFGVKPEQFVDFLSLSGDSTNNIPGVPSVGPKTAARLLFEFNDLDNILSVADMMKGKTGEMLRSHAEDARMSQKLVRLCNDLELSLNLKSFRYTV